ncbi:hypothetical protein BRC64_04960 [Halobacteriales archaeon QH_10_67_22]|nr:MAG: hypothetical protein BRC64_04960 [Halobacteriales archaeon QH_10_67_22]
MAPGDAGLRQPRLEHAGAGQLLRRRRPSRRRRPRSRRRRQRTRRRRPARRGDRLGVGPGGVDARDGRSSRRRRDGRTRDRLDRRGGRPPRRPRGVAPRRPRQSLGRAARRRDGPVSPRFLSVFESVYTDIEEEIEDLPRYFDPEGVPGEYLSWLNRWLALETGADWPESARRELLARAPSLFKRRGTRAGLRAYLQLYLDHVTAPDTGWILEWQRRRIEDRRASGHLSEAAAEARLDAVDDLADRGDGHHLFFMERLDLDGMDSEAAREPYTMHMSGPRSFAVFVGPFMDSTHRAVVEDVVAAEKPAHAEGTVVPMRQHVKLEGNSFLGINTTLTPRTFVLDRASLGEDSVLKEQDLL